MSCQTSEEEGEMFMGPCKRRQGRGLETSRDSGTLLGWGARQRERDQQGEC